MLEVLDPTLGFMLFLQQASGGFSAQVETAIKLLECEANTLHPNTESQGRCKGGGTRGDQGQFSQVSEGQWDLPAEARQRCGSTGASETAEVGWRGHAACMLVANVAQLQSAFLRCGEVGGWGTGGTSNPFPLVPQLC